STGGAAGLGAAGVVAGSAIATVRGCGAGASGGTLARFRGAACGAAGCTVAGALAGGGGAAASGAAEADCSRRRSVSGLVGRAGAGATIVGAAIIVALARGAASGSITAGTIGVIARQASRHAATCGKNPDGSSQRSGTPSFSSAALGGWASGRAASGGGALGRAGAVRMSGEVSRSSDPGTTVLWCCGAIAAVPATVALPAASGSAQPGPAIARAPPHTAARASESERW